MRKICTVLLLNLLRSSRRFRLIASCMLLTLAAVASFVFIHVGKASLNMTGQRANAVNTDNTAPTDPNTQPTSQNQPEKAVNPQKDTSNSGTKDATGSSSSANNSESTKQPNASELKIKDVALDQPTKVCTANSQQPAYAVQAAHLTMTSSFHGAGAIKWYWETRVDGGESTDTPPISNQINTQNAAAGSLPVTFQSDNGTDPLLTAPTSSTYSYSFRLHILTPNEVVSDWIAVPVVLDNSCQTSQQ